LIRTPLSRFSVVSGVLERALELTNVSGSRSLMGEPLPGMKLRAFPYEMGSDHDVLNFFGIPSVMPITWPDRFYHSSGDTVEKVSLETIAIIGNAVLATALALAGEEAKTLRGFARGYAMKVLGEISMVTESEESERLVMRGLARDSEFIGFDLGHDFGGEPWLEWKAKGVINERLIRARQGDAELFRRLTEDRSYWCPWCPTGPPRA